MAVNADGRASQVVTVTGIVLNESSADVALSRDDTPDVIGYNAGGGIETIELYGTWDNSERDVFVIKSGASLAYTTVHHVTNDSLREVIAFYSAPQIGSLIAGWNDGEFIRCGSPLLPAGYGSDYAFAWSGP